MSIKYHKANKYQKIQIDTGMYNSIYINCRTRPSFVYDLRDVKICTDFVRYNIEDRFMKVHSIICYSEEVESPGIELRASKINSYFTLKEDFSNINEIINKFDSLIETSYKTHEWHSLSLYTNKLFNCIAYSDNGLTKNMWISIRNNFDNFNIIDEYDFIITEGEYPEFNNKIILSGGYLKTKSFIAKLNKKLSINELTVDIGDEINNIKLVDSEIFDDTILEVCYLVEKQKYNINFMPRNINQFSYLKLLNNNSIFKKSYARYTENDIIAKMYDI